MTHDGLTSGRAIVIGASGQDGYFLTERLINQNWRVHAVTRAPEAPAELAQSPNAGGPLEIHVVDLTFPPPLFDLIAQIQPEEIYNLAGQSSVSRSFTEPGIAWRTNADFVAELLECVRLKSAHSRLYQASSTDMFGGSTDQAVFYDENSALNPRSPYASAKAAAHRLCQFYRETYGLRIASGILANHESHRRPTSFLTRKVVEHVMTLQDLSTAQVASLSPLTLGNLKVRRDWGFAPDYVQGMCAILRQIDIRGTKQVLEDIGRNYRDYVLSTGETHAVWELVDSAFRIGGFDLEWDLEGDDPASWRGYFSATGAPAVIVNPQLLRMSEPLIIQVDPSRARAELGWAPRRGVEVFLNDMFANLRRTVAAKGVGSPTVREG
ncbi:MAG TPA: GDP-mannose 4,6-dehydratase [Pyrinomonadaceae bacterium]|nr:GDP-mannose 4,6-dehydratase [Pyrinomonadaceae bacterium]